MSANIYWKTVRPQQQRSLHASAPSSFIRSMEKAFGRFPCRVNKECIAKLEGMAAVYGEGPETNPYSELVNLLEQIDEIELWAEY